MKKVLKLLFVTSLSGFIGGKIIKKNMENENTNIKNLSDKHLSLFLMMDQWVRVKQEGKNLVTYFKRHNYKKIAIYGMSYVGKTLVNELEDTDINIAYAIDKNANSIYSELNVISLDEKLDNVDVIIVTAISSFDEIEEQISKKINCPIVSIENVLYEI